MKRGSDSLRGFEGANPFREAQAKMFGEEKVAREFYPTSIYNSLFNDQHEILLGTRGSGKTMILRMLSYSCIRKLKPIFGDEKAPEHKYIGFYIPMHLEFMASLPGKDTPDENKLGYFQFALNCSAAKSFLNEIYYLLSDIYIDPKTRFDVESKIVGDLGDLWFSSTLKNVYTVKELQWRIDQLYSTQEFWIDGTKPAFVPLAKEALIPIVQVLPRVNDILNLDSERTTWLACIDETEFVREPYLRCINSFIRTEKRPLVIKMATLPSKHTTKETTEKGVYIEPKGNDFNYRAIDLDWDSDDFRKLTNHICEIRMGKIGFSEKVGSIEDFLGRVGDDDELKDYYRNEFGEEASREENILRGILELLPEARKRRYETIKDDKTKVLSQYFKRFSPVYYVRRMKDENSRGNRTVGWFAGANTVRRVSDGNPRRFIQLMNDLVENARRDELTPKNQHRVITSFCGRAFNEAEGLPEIGAYVKSLIERIGTLLANRVHGKVLLDGGCRFYIGSEFGEDKLFVKSLNIAIDYSHFIRVGDKSGEIDIFSGLRLSYVHAVYFWLPMRMGTPPIIQSKHLGKELFSTCQPYIEAPIPELVANKLVKALELNIQEPSDE